ncbi:NAD(P)H-binding protein [Zhengella sp. ZM62]|uniref:NmrA family NAD(P)-binding protein n=1 Tax=Zhengella sedimenti TaxID=3390035 RepID=UPI0039770F34
MATIAIIGAAGHIGFTAGEAFVQAGWTVKGIGRGTRVSEMPAGVVPVAGDAHDAASLTAATRGADVILHAANPAYDKWETTVLPMVENAIAAAKAHGATLMIPGNVYNFGLEIGMGMDEDAPQNASTDKARIRIAMEERLERATREEGVQVIILRAGDFYGGPKGGTWLDLMILKDLKKDRFTWPGPWTLPHAFAYLPDLARAFVALAERRAELGRFERFHFAGHTLTGEQMLAAAEQAAGRRLKRADVNWTMLKLVGLFMPVVREVVKMNYLWRTAHSLDGARLEALAGPQQVTPPAAALRQAIADQHLDGPARRAA